MLLSVIFIKKNNKKNLLMIKGNEGFTVGSPVSFLIISNKYEGLIKIVDLKWEYWN
jgi:hypothetical protein